jgi:hypothetical protein
MEAQRREKPKIEGGAQEGVVVRDLDEGESDLNI